MGQYLNVNGDYTVKIGAGNKITLDTGEIGQVLVSGDLIVDGVIKPKNISIRDNIFVLNQDEVAEGVSLDVSGIEIDRGSLTNVAFLWSETNNGWSLVDSNEIDGYSVSSSSRLSLYEVVTEIISTTANDLILNPSKDLIYSGSQGSLFKITDGANTTFQIDSYLGITKIETPVLATGTSILDISTTWNNSNEPFYGISLDVINNGSNVDSRFLSFLISGNEKFSIDLDGNIRIDGSLFVIGDIDVTTINIDNNTENAFRIQTNTNEYLNINTTIGSETVSFKKGNVVISDNLKVNGGNLISDQLTFNLLNTAVSTVNFAGAAATVNIGSSIGTTTVNNNLDVVGNLTVNGTLTSLETTTLEVEDPLVKFGKGNIGDLFSIGFYGEYIDNSSVVKKTGFFRDHISKDFYLFDDLDSNITVSNTIDTQDLSLANLRANTITAATLIGVIDGGVY